MHVMQVLGILDNCIRNYVNNLQMRNQIDVNRAQFILNEWAANQQMLATRVINSGQYPNGDINETQALGIAQNFVNRALQNFTAATMGMNMGMNPGMMNPMMGGGMMPNQYQGMTPGGMFQQPNMFGGMYGGNAAAQPMQTNPYSSTMNVPKTTAQFSAEMLGQAAQPMPQPTPQPAQQVQEQPPVVEEKVTWSISKYPNQEVDEAHGVKEVRSKLTVADNKDPLALTKITTDEAFGSDLECIQNTSRVLKRHNGPELASFEYNKYTVLSIPKTMFQQFKAYLKNKINPNDFTRVADYRDAMNVIISTIKEHFQDMTVKNSSNLESLIMSCMNYRGMAGELAPAGIQNYQITAKSLDDLFNLDNPDRVLFSLLNTIKDIINMEEQDLMDADIRNAVQDQIGSYYHLEDLSDITDEQIIKDTIDEVNNGVTVTKYRRIVYYMTGIKIPGVFKDNSIRPAYSPAFHGEPDNSCEYALSEFFTTDYNKFGPIRMYAQPTRNLMLAYTCGHTTDNRLRLVPCAI